MHLVEAGDTRILLDCGLVRGAKDEEHKRNREFPFDPTTLTAVVLSHAHVDHAGNLPNLVKQGYDGPIYCTPATRELISVMLADSARIQEDEAHLAGVTRGKNPADRRALYNRGDVRNTLDQCVETPYGTAEVIANQIELRFHDAGHILGSALVELNLEHRGASRRITFTGDLGRRGLPFLPDPCFVPAADLVICESTYGGRTHETVDAMADRMADIVKRTVARGGKVYIPAFSLGRTQVVAHYLQRWMRDGVLPRLPILVDSPLAAQIAEVYEQFPEALLQADVAAAPPVEYLGRSHDAHSLLYGREPCIVIASGGMCDGGKILQHLRRHVDDPRCSLVLVSYQAPHSLGAQLLETNPTVRFHGRNWNKWIEVIELNGFSGHADQNDFLALLGPAAGKTGRVRLVHGEPKQAEALANCLLEHGFKDVAAPHREDTVSVG
jgi:metallo-beta-lactamase family protein